MNQPPALKQDVRRLSRLDESAFLIAHGLDPIARRLDGAGRSVTWDFPSIPEVHRLIDLFRRYDVDIRLMLDFTEAHEAELREIAKMRYEYRAGRRGAAR